VNGPQNQSRQNDIVPQTPDQTELPLPEQPDKLLGNTFAGKYKILEVLGRGGMSVVYKAQDLLLHRTVCVKMLLASYATVSNNYLRLQQEARAASKLKHSNIVQVYEFTVTEDQIPYLIMDFVDGISLEQLLNRDGPMSEARALRAFVQIADALSHAHVNGVVHRDLKPSNIIIENGPDLVPKIVDFGIAKIFAEASAAPTNLTQSGEIFGSPLYMSPEQCNSAQVDFRADMYSFGCVLFEALTGSPPFDADNAIKLAFKHINERPPALEDVAKKTFSPLLEGVVAKLLKKQPEQRYATMAELCEDLHRLNVGVKPIATKKRARWRDWIVPLSAAVGVATAVAIGICIHHNWSAQRSTAEYQKKLVAAKSMLADGIHEHGRNLRPQAAVSFDAARKVYLAALPLCTSAAQSAETNLGVAETYLYGENYEAARSYLLEAETQDLKANPGGGMMSASIARDIADCDIENPGANGNAADARKHLDIAVDKNRQGDKSDFALGVLVRRYNLEFHEHNYGDAEAAAKKLIDVSTQMFGPNSPTTATQMERLGNVLLQQQQYTAAADWLVPAFKMRLATAQRADRQTLSSMIITLTQCLKNSGNDSLLTELQDKFHETFTRLDEQASKEALKRLKDKEDRHASP